MYARCWRHKPTIAFLTLFAVMVLLINLNITKLMKIFNYYLQKQRKHILSLVLILNTQQYCSNLFTLQGGIWFIVDYRNIDYSSCKYTTYKQRTKIMKTNCTAEFRVDFQCDQQHYSKLLSLQDVIWFAVNPSVKYHVMELQGSYTVGYTDKLQLFVVSCQILHVFDFCTALIPFFFNTLSIHRQM